MNFHLIPLGALAQIPLWLLILVGILIGPYFYLLDQQRLKLTKLKPGLQILIFVIGMIISFGLLYAALDLFNRKLILLDLVDPLVNELSEAALIFGITLPIMWFCINISINFFYHSFLSKKHSVTVEPHYSWLPTVIGLFFEIIAVRSYIVMYLAPHLNIKNHYLIMALTLIWYTIALFIYRWIDSFSHRLNRRWAFTTAGRNSKNWFQPLRRQSRNHK